MRASTGQVGLLGNPSRAPCHQPDPKDARVRWNPQEHSRRTAKGAAISPQSTRPGLNPRRSLRASSLPQSWQRVAQQLLKSCCASRTSTTFGRSREYVGRALPTLPKLDKARLMLCPELKPTLANNDQPLAELAKPLANIGKFGPILFKWWPCFLVSPARSAQLSLCLSALETPLPKLCGTSRLLWSCMQSMNSGAGSCRRILTNYVFGQCMVQPNISCALYTSPIFKHEPASV